MKKISLLGQTFGHLLVIGSALPKNNETYWLCRCICEKELEVGGKNLRYGRSKSCGCATKELHGASHTVEYAIWRQMLNRCQNPKNQDWRLYGERGISVEWDTFAEFFRDMGRRPSPLHSIDRINGNRSYSAENCRWATPTQQARNMRVNRLITFDGKTLCLSEWAELTGISRNCIEKRIDTLHWTVDDALSVPVQAQKRRRFS